MSITLPWPHKALSPNTPIHWAAKAKHKKAARMTGYMLARQAGITLDPEAKPLVTLTFVPPDRRARDRDNMLASLKSHLDGVADAIGCDDSRWRLQIEVAEEVGGFVRVEISL